MDRKMMNAWLAEQAKKAQITEAQMQRKRLGINEDSMVKDVPVTRKNEPKVPGDIPEPTNTQPPSSGVGTGSNFTAVPTDPKDSRKMDEILPSGFRPFGYAAERNRGEGENADPNLSIFEPDGRPEPRPQPKVVKTRGRYGTAKPYLITVSEAAVRNKILGVVPQAEARNKAGESATTASTPITEQLNAEEEKYAKEHKSMLAGMIKQYGKEKGTRVFYATVRNKVRGK